MISLHPVCNTLLAPQATRSAVNRERPAPTNRYSVAPAIQFGDNRTQPSLLGRVKQGIIRLWQTFLAPFKWILSWFKQPTASPRSSGTPNPSPSTSPDANPANVQPPSELTGDSEAPLGNHVAPMPFPREREPGNETVPPVSHPVPSARSSPSVIPVEELFGPDLTRIQFQQCGANTCYLLSALDAIFHHPQGRKILDLIQINRTENGYMVKFPGYGHPILVATTELNHFCKSKTPGVSLLELAYLKLPDALPPSEYDSTTAALTRMFGQDRIQQPSFEETSMIASAQESPIIDEFADIWTAVDRIKDQAGKPIKTGEHYFSIRLNPNEPNQVELVNPYDTGRVQRTLSLGELENDYFPELSRIRLGD